MHISGTLATRMAPHKEAHDPEHKQWPYLQGSCCVDRNGTGSQEVGTLRPPKTASSFLD